MPGVPGGDRAVTHYGLALYGTHDRIRQYIAWLSDQRFGGQQVGIRELRLFDLVIHNDHEEGLERQLARLHGHNYFEKDIGSLKFKAGLAALRRVTPYSAFSLPDPDPLQDDLGEALARHLYAVVVGRKRWTKMSGRVGDT